MLQGARTILMLTNQNEQGDGSCNSPIQYTVCGTHLAWTGQ